MNDVRVKTVTAVALCVVIPMLIVVHLVDRKSADTLGSPWAVLVLFVLGLVLVGVGLNILSTIDPTQRAGPEPAAPPSPPEPEEPPAQT